MVANSRLLWLSARAIVHSSLAPPRDQFCGSLPSGAPPNRASPDPREETTDGYDTDDSHRSRHLRNRHSGNFDLSPQKQGLDRLCIRTATGRILGCKRVLLPRRMRRYPGRGAGESHPRSRNLTVSPCLAASSHSPASSSRLIVLRYGLALFPQWPVGEQFLVGKLLHQIGAMTQQLLHMAAIVRRNKEKFARAPAPHCQ